MRWQIPIFKSANALYWGKMENSPLAIYRAWVAQGRISDDPAQRHAVEALQLLTQRLRDYDAGEGKTSLLGLFGWGREKLTIAPVPGLYLYGGVGRGKSMLMDMFFDTVAMEHKRRVHFHAFMQEMHAAIHEARGRGVADPILEVAVQVAQTTHLLCFDEMQITDITDAMLVGRLFEALFARNVVVVATSNRHPDALYKDGLNRDLFLPFIALIKERLILHHLEDGADFRQNREAGELPVYFAPNDAQATSGLRQWWQRLAKDEQPLVLEIQGRKLEFARHSEGIVWARFQDICEAALGAADYLALAQAAHTLFLSDIPQMGRDQANAAKRFVTLIDALYESQTRLICSAQAAPEMLYTDGPGAFEFERTASRLREMQAADWGRAITS